MFDIMHYQQLDREKLSLGQWIAYYHAQILLPTTEHIPILKLGQEQPYTYD